MSLAELFIIAIRLSMDAFAVSVCKGTGHAQDELEGAFIVGLYFGDSGSHAIAGILPWLRFSMTHQEGV